MMDQSDRHLPSDLRHLSPTISVAALVLSLLATSAGALEIVGAPPYHCTAIAACIKENECLQLGLNLEVFAWPNNQRTSGFDYRREKTRDPSAYVLEGLRGSRTDADYYEDTDSARLALIEFVQPVQPDVVMVEERPQHGERRDFRVYSLNKDRGSGQITFGPGYTHLTCSNIYR